MKKLLLLSTILIGVSTLVFAQTAKPVPAPVPAPGAAVAAVPLPATPAKAAPDVQEQVNTALAEYQQKRYGKAADALDAASIQIRKMKSTTLAQFLPAAPQGWTIKEDRAASFMANIPGNGSMAERIYLSGGEEVKIGISTDSKLMGAMRRLNVSANAPMQFMGHDYVFKTADSSVPQIIRKNEATLFVSDNLTIGVSGEKLTDQQAQGFLGLFDLPKLKAEAEK